MPQHQSERAKKLKMQALMMMKLLIKFTFAWCGGETKENILTVIKLKRTDWQISNLVRQSFTRTTKIKSSM
jgi:hypothetical protein